MAAQVALRRQQESDEAASHLSYGSMQLCFNPNMHKASRIIPPSPTSPREGQITQRSASLSSRSSSPNDEVSNEFESPTSSANEGKLDKLFIILAFHIISAFHYPNRKNRSFRKKLNSGPSFQLSGKLLECLLLLKSFDWFQGFYAHIRQKKTALVKPWLCFKC